ncbi:MAG: hypothetical protein IH597_15920 [Bacteroidales bacterium]|nr:hypothetical protein [Bacteroidales bacterium]
MKNNLHNKKNGLTRLLGQFLMVVALLISGSQLFGQASLLSYSNNLTTLSGCDDCNQSVSITSVFPYGVRFGANTYTSVYVGSNGYITFGHGNSGYSPLGIQAYTSGPIIAAQYDDLDPRKGGNVYFDQNTGSNFVVATWHTVYPYNSSVGGGVGTNGVTFQVVLRKPGSYSSTNLDFQIEIRYNNIGWWKSGNNSAWPTAGWSAGNQITYALLPYSGQSNFNQNQYNSNISQTGVWRWDVTGGVVQAAPTVNQTYSVTSITGSSGNSGGNVSSDGGSTVIERGIVYSTTNPPITIHSKVISGAGTGSFTASMSGLNPGTLYYVRAYAINSIGTGYGPLVSFSTSNISVPSVSTTTVSTVTTNAASSGGNVTATGGATVNNRGVVWNTSGSPTISSYTGITSNGIGTGSYSSSLTGLASNTTYYVRAYATNSAGTGYGSQLSFITQPANPSSASANPSTTCSGSATQLSVSNAQGTVYWYTGGCGTTFIGTGNPFPVYPTTTTTYYARNYNASGFSAGCASATVTVNQPASTPTSASGTPTGTTAANLSFGGSTGSGTITYYWVVGTSSSVAYGNGIAQGSTTTTSAVATGLSQSITYYLRVYANNLCGNSSYLTSSSFRTHSVLTYLAGPDGSISGTTPQTIANGGNGTAVTAVPDTEYNFINWSDGSTNNPRTDLNVTSSTTVTANFAPNRLVFLTSPVNTAAGQNIPVSVRITDTYGNTMTNSSAAVTLAIQTNPSIGEAGVLNGTLTLNAVNGVATFTDLWINKTGNGYTLIASAGSPIITQPVSEAFNIIPGALEYFTVAGIVSPHMAGVTTSPTVTAYDEFDNLKYDYTGTIEFSTNNVSNNPAQPTTLPDGYTFLTADLGVKTFINGVNLKETGAFYVKVNDGSKEGQQGDIEVTPAPINYFTLAANGSVIAGTEFSVTATVYDEFGNVKTNYDGQNDVLWTTTASSSPRGNPRVMPANGPQGFTAGIAVVGGFIFYNAQETPTITITDGPTSSPGTTAPIIVYNAPLNNFLVEPVPVESHNIGGVRKQAGIPFSVKVTARDVYFNIARDYAGNIRFKSSNDVLVQFPGGTPSFAGYQGVRTFNDAITVNQIGSYWLRAADALQAFKSGELKDIVIGPGPVNASLSELTISYTSPVIAGDYVQVTIIPRDAFGNFLCTCQDVQILLQGDDEHRAGSGNTWIPIPSSALINTGNGSYVTNVRVTETGLNVFSAVVNTVTLNQTRDVMVDPAPPSLANTLITAASPEMTTDENVVLTVQLKDEFDNNRTTNDGEVSLNTTLGGFGINNGPVSIEAFYTGSGIYIASLYASYDAVNHGVGNATITGVIDFTDPLLTDGSIVDNEIVSITEGLPNLVTSTISADPTSISTDETSLITLQLKDHLGNLVQNNRGEATLLSNVLGELSATSYDDDGRYIAILSGDVRPLNGVGIAYITGSFAGSGSASGVNGFFNDGGSPSQLSTATVTITEGLPDVATIQIEADPLTMTTDGSSIITVTLKDHLGNPIVNSRGTVALTTSLGAISIVTDHLNGTYSATLTGNVSGTGIATISGTIVIDNIGEPQEIDDTAEVEITEGLPNLAQSTIVSNPNEMTTDGSSTITLQLKDQWGNSLTTSRGVVSMESTIGLLSSVTDNGNGTYSATLTGDTRGVNGTGSSIITASFVGDVTAPGVVGNFVNSTQVEIIEGLPAIATIDIAADPISMTTDDSSTITVQLRDQFGNLILNNRGPVVLSTDLGVIGDTDYTSAGQYAAILTANSSGTGTATIEGTIQIDGSGLVLDIVDFATVQITEGLPSLAQSSISAFPLTMTTDESSNITLQLKDQWGNLLSSSRGVVTMESTIGLLSSVTDNNDGTYAASLTGDTRGLNGTGLSLITASFEGTGTAETVSGNFADNTTVEITEGLPSGLTTTITANPVEMTIDQSSLISVQLKDWLGNLIVNDRAEVSLFTDLGILTPVNYIDNGIYTATLSGNDQGTGLATITGSFAIIGDITVADIIDIDDDATVLITEGLPAVAEIQITADPLTMTTDEISVISVQLYDQFGNTIVNDRGTVALSTNRGNLSGVTYIENGLYTATLYGNADGVGVATITGTIIIDDSGDAVAIDDNAQVTITEGLPAVAMIQITADPLTMTTDESSLISVQLYDQFGNMIVNNRGTVALSTDRGNLLGVSYVSNGLYTATLYGNADGVGVATITGTIIIDDIGDAVAIIDNAQVTITEGLPAIATIEITAEPTTMTTDESSTITVQLRDQFGNTIVTNRGPVVLSTNLGVIGVTNYTINGQYAATLTANSSGTGIATITGTIQIDGEEPALDIADNATVLITEGLPSLAQSSISASAETMTTDGSSTITLQLKDQWGNLLTSSRGIVTMESSIGLLSSVTDNFNGTYTATLTGDTRGLNGTGISEITASFDGTGSAETVEGDFANNTTVEITEGLPVVATTTITADPVEMTIDQTSLISVQLKDQFGNLIVNDRAVVQLNTSRGVLTVVTYFEAGVYHATLSGNNQGVGLATITGTIQADGEGSHLQIVDDATVLIIEGVPAIATTIITADPSEMTIDQTSLISVQLIDQFGNLIVNDRATVALSTDRGVLTGVIYVGNGIYTATLSGNSDGVGLATITGTIQIDGGGAVLNISDNATVLITEGLPNVLTSTITASPITMTSDASSVVTVQLKDQFGNLIVNNRGTVVLSTDLGVLTVTSYDGAGTYIATLTGNESGTGIATLTGTIVIDDEGSPQAFNDDAQVIITEGLPNLSQISITADPESITADGTSLILVQLKDQWGNNLTSSRGTIALSTSPIGALTSVTDNLDGTYNATFFLNAFGTGLATITGTLAGEVNGNISDDAIVTVTHGVATQLTILTEPSPTAMAGVPFATQPQVRIEDQFGNLVSGDNTTEVTATRYLGTEQLYGTVTVTATDGIATFTDLYYTKMETITLIYSSDTDLSNSNAISSQIVVDHAATAYYTITDANFIMAGGARAPYTVKRYDEFGNIVNKVVGNTDANEPVYLYSSSTGANKQFRDAATGGNIITLINILPGATSANFWYYDEKTGMHTITVSDNSVAPDGDLGVNDASDLIEVRPAALKDFLVYGIESPHYYGDIQTVTVEARDLFNNRKINYTGSITFSITDFDAIPPADYQFTLGNAGIMTFPASILFTKPSSFSPVDEWWVTAIDLADPTKYGAQTEIIVLERPINVIADHQVKYFYGDAYDLGTNLFTVSSGIEPEAEIYANSELITNVTLASDGTDPAAFVGDYDIVTSNATGINGFNPAYYNINYSTAGKLTVVARPITIEVSPELQAKVYGEMDPIFSYTVSSALNLVNNDQFTGALAREIGEDVGLYGIDQGSLLIYDEDGLVNKTANYNITFIGGDFEITKKPVLVTADEQNKTYGDDDPALTFVSAPVNGSVLPNGIAVSFSGELIRELGETVGSYEIYQGSLNNDNYTITYVGDLLNIAPLAVQVTADAKEKTYGDLDPLLTFVSVPAVGSTLQNGLTISFTGELIRITGENVGDYAILKNTVNNSNYTITYTGANLTIHALDVDVYADAKSKVYGQVDPALTFESEPEVGFELANGEVIGFNGALNRDLGEAVGNYTINQHTVDNGNYNITYHEADLVITQLQVQVFADVQSKTYGDIDPILTFVSNPTVGTELDNGDAIAFTGELSRVAGEDVGAYNILQNNVANSNYDIVYTGAQLTIIPLAVAVNAEPKVKIFGQLDPAFTFVSDPAVGAVLANFEVIEFTGALLREPGEDVGAYAIYQNSVANTNYTITYTGADLTISKLDVSVTAHSQSKTYGDLDPVLSFTSDPAVGFELDNGIYIGYTGSLVRAMGEDVGSYEIGQGSLGNNNFNISFTGNSLEIDPLAVTVAADGKSKVYGNLDPDLTFVSNPIVGYTLPNDEVIGFTGWLNRDAGETVGSYTINRNSLDNSNYTITYVENELEITPLAVTVTADSKTKVYGNADPALTFVSDPAVGSTLPNNLIIEFSGELDRNAGENVGSYNIYRNTVNNTNYNISYFSDLLTITERPLTITAENRNKTYGDLLVLGTTEFSISGDGMAFTETIDELTLNSDGTPVLADAGVYPIHTSNAVGSQGFLLSNYNITYSSAGTLMVEARPLTLYDFGAANKTYDGSTTVIGTGWFDNRLPGDILAFSFEANFEDKNVGTNKTVNYTNIAIVGGPDQFNYHLLTVDGTANASILAKALSITANDLTKAYGNTLVFEGTEFESAGMVNGETIASITLVSDGTPSNAPLGVYPIVASDAVGNTGTLMTNYLITYFDGELTVEFSLLGTVSYWKNNNDIPIQDVVVKLINNQSQVLATATTDAAGAYTFIEQNPGEIDRIEVSTSLPWGGNNSTDALAIQLKTVGLPPAYWTPSNFIDFVGDVNSNNAVNATDALFVRNRSIYTIDSYPAGDWAFNAKNLGMNFTNINLNTAVFNYSDLNSNILDIRALCFGDVNGSYNFGGAKSLTSAHNDEITKVVPGMQFEIPVRVDKTIEFSALSLQLAYPDDKISIVGIKSDINGLEYNVANGFINIGWYNLNPVVMQNGDAIITLVVTSNAPIGSDDDIFFFSSETEFADKSGEVIQNYDLSMSRIDNSMEYALQCYPNPFNDFMSIGYSMVEPGDVKISVVNSLGSVVTVLADHHHEAGNHILGFTAGKYTLSKGLYFVRMEVRTENTSFTKLASVIFVE